MAATEARERSFIPEASEETPEAFTSSEMKHATAYKRTVDKLIATINLIKSAEAPAKGWTVARSLQRENVNMGCLCHVNGISQNYEWIITKL